MHTILNIAAGKMQPLYMDEIAEYGYMLINLDPMYFKGTPADVIEDIHSRWMAGVLDPCQEVKLISEAIPFMDRTTIEFDHISCYRFLEHVPKTDILYFLYSMSTAMKIGGTFDFIVPNYIILAELLLNEGNMVFKSPGDFEAHDILLTYEMLNEPGCPHASIWTPTRAHYFFGLEGRFEITSLDESFEFDGRDIYMRIQGKRIK
ncbi:hypothetical protein KAR91_13100 [Candidatus Pacearchaeota archaeon]|nr:hypothetical protein [Candidatus Pacearchaeota archaeon]